MSDQRKGGIAWTDHTWNPIRGCSRVSKGCENCYAEQVAKRWSGPGQPYEGLVRIDKDGKSKAQWNGRVKFIDEHLTDPLHWTRPRTVFVNSMSDLFHDNVSFSEIAAIFGVMAASPRHTFQVLTKRPGRARAFFGWVAAQDIGLDGTAGRLHCVFEALRAEVGEELHTKHCADPDGPWPLPNVWLGVSVEDQESANQRIPHLLACPAAVRWVSYEPALGPVDFRHIDADSAGHEWGQIDSLTGKNSDMGRPWRDAPGKLDWIVIGGESGTGARPFDLAWARSVLSQARKAGAACFVKQLGANAMDPPNGLCGAATVVPDHAEAIVNKRLKDRKGGDMDEWPENLRVREWPGGVK